MRGAYKIFKTEVQPLVFYLGIQAETAERRLVNNGGFVSGMDGLQVYLEFSFERFFEGQAMVLVSPAKGRISDQTELVRASVKSIARTKIIGNIIIHDGIDIIKFRSAIVDGGIFYLFQQPIAIRGPTRYHYRQLVRKNGPTCRHFSRNQPD